MAGDWVKMEKATPGKPEVMRLAKKLGVTNDHAVGLCFRFWCWCDDQLTDCFLEGVTKEMIDERLQTPGAAEALIAVGWITEAENILSVPHFDRHLSNGAKTRAVNAKRVSNSREAKEKRAEKARARMQNVRTSVRKTFAQTPPKK